MNMPLNIKKHDFNQIILDNYYIFIILLYFITFKIRHFSVGIFSSLIMMIIVLGNIFAGKLKTELNRIDILVLMYLVYCTVSVVAVLLNGISIVTYLQATSNSLLPIIFYYAARKDGGMFYNRFLYAVLFCCLIGSVLLFVRPLWFYLYCKDYGYSYTRLSSCIGSTAVGCLSISAILVSIKMVIDKNGKKGKLFYALSVVFAFISMQRSAWIVAFLSIVIMHYYAFVKWKCLKKKYVLYEIVSIICVTILSQKYITNLVITWINEHRVSGGYGMLSSRTNQWINALKNTNWLIGTGFGTTGHKAIGQNVDIITDGSWVCTFCELGIIGTGLLLGIVLMAVYFGVKNKRKLFLPIGIIVCISLQAIGSNLFEYQIIMPIFWYAIGNISYENNRKRNGNTSDESIRNISPTIS